MDLQELLSKYETALERGESPTPEEACRGHPELLERFLQHARAMRSITPPKAREFTATASTQYADAPSRRLQVIKPHARGGLGEVYLANDDALGREVALKVMQGPLAADRCRRFEREAAITAKLQHPGIVPIYGTVVDDLGRPGHVMRFVTGPTFAEAIADFHAKRGAFDRSDMAFRNLLTRLGQVAQTIAFAHNRGVVHRDLKPGNVILGDFGETIVIDWGLAHELRNIEEGVADVAADSEAGGSLTATGATLGTPTYFSPEQARGEPVTMATDIFALGGLLYSILTNLPPYGDMSYHERQNRSRGGDVPPARERNPSAPAALDAVCRKAMAAIPQERYADALAFAAEIEHWLADEPLSCVSDPLRIRMRRWTRRHRLLVGSGLAALVVAAVSLAVATGLLSRKNQDLNAAIRMADDNARAANEAGILAAAREKDADANFQTACDALSRFTLQLSEDPRLRGFDSDSLRKDMLLAAAEFYRKLAQGRSDDPNLRRQIVKAHYLLGMIAQDTGYHDNAEKEYNLALAKLPPDGTSRDDKLIESDIHAGLSAALRMRNDYQGALDAMRKSHAAAIAALGRDPANLEDRFLLAGVEEHLAINISMVQGDSTEANEVFEHVFKLAIANRDADQITPKYWITLPRAYNEHGKMKYRAKNLPAAEKSWLAGRKCHAELRTQAIDRGNYLKHNLADLCNQLGMLYRDSRRISDAEEAFGEALRISTVLVTRHPQNAFYTSDKATALLGTGTIRNIQGKYSDAEPLLREAIQLRMIVFRRAAQMVYERHALINSHTALCRSLLEQKKFTEAAAEATTAAKLVDAVPSDADIAIPVVVSWARIGMGSSDPSISRPAFDAALQMIRTFAVKPVPKEVSLMLQQLDKAGGFKDAARVTALKDPSFAALAELPIYQAIVKR